MASVRSRNHQGEKEDDEFRSWRSPHHKTSDHFRKHDRHHHEQQGQGETRERRDRERYNDRRGSSDNNAGHRTRYRESKPHRWTSDKRTPDGNKKMDLKSSSEFPSLGAKEMKTRSSFTPDVVRPSTQRSVITSSASWADKIVQFEQDKQRAMKDMMKYKRRLLMSESSDGSNEDQDLHKGHKVNMSAEPKKEYETDENIIVRRQKQIEYGKNTLGYDNYLQEVPKNKRAKGKHMSTPNKFHKCSRRAWEGLVRQWRKKLHEYDPADTYKPDTVARKELHFSDTTSEASSTDTDAKMDIDLNNSLSSAISDYLASNESSRPQTPELVKNRPTTPTTELKGLSVNDHLNGNHPEVKVPNQREKGDTATPDSTLTPTVTPADHEVEDNNNYQPQFNPGDLLAALHQASQNMQPPPQVMPAVFNLNLQCARPPLVPFVVPNVNSLPCPKGVNANQQMSKKAKKGDIFDNFNLDDCFKTDDVQ
ncbi:histone RNA hairpin-binding protein-like [Asterias rubens]|uniref:histone RNA hairpin-binding protein-like n=1 Tax=Asterias rubens TaxID=7604 RepID=UPI0014559271|nr:histone RNA hairpin-binding protein-like [Asterias rubens]